MDQSQTYKQTEIEIKPQQQTDMNQPQQQIKQKIDQPESQQPTKKQKIELETKTTEEPEDEESGDTEPEDPRKMEYHQIIITTEEPDIVHFYYVPKDKMKPEYINLLSKVVDEEDIETGKIVSPAASGKEEEKSWTKLNRLIFEKGIFDDCLYHGLGTTLGFIKVIKSWSFSNGR